MPECFLLFWKTTSPNEYFYAPVMPYLISYDIENDRLRGKIANRLIAAGCVRLQKSVFAGQVKDTVFKELSNWLYQSIKNPGDSIFILDIGPETLRHALWVGQQAPDWSFATGPPDVFFI